MSASPRVLGTRIFKLPPAAPREAVLLLSDLHLSPRTPRILEWLARTLELARHEGLRRAVILGDLFEFWVGPRQSALRGFSDVLDVLRAATQSGLDVSVLQGNRDFMLERNFGRAAGVRVVEGGAEIESGGRRFLLLHGDEMCLNDVRYQKTRPLLRSWLVRWILRGLPLVASLRLAGAARRASRRNEAPTHGDFLPVKEAMERCFAAGFDGLVIGHIHRGADGTFHGDHASGDYSVLPAFDATGISALLEDGKVRFRDLKGVRVATFGALEFPPIRRSAGKSARSARPVD